MGNNKMIKPLLVTNRPQYKLGSRALFFNAALLLQTLALVFFMLTAMIAPVQAQGILYNGQAYDVAVDSGGNVIVTGKCNDGTTWNYCTVKYDPDGNELWHRVYDGGNWDAALGVAVDSEDNIVVVGGSSNGTNDDYRVIKYDSQGNELWQQSYDGGGSDIAYAVAIDSQDNIVVTGESGKDYYTIKYSSSGSTLLWSATFNSGGENRDIAFGVAVDSADNVIVTGSTQFGTTASDYYTIKYDSNGTELWHKGYDAGYGDCANGVAVDSAENVIVTGYSSDNKTINNYCTLKYDPDGNEVWVQPVIYDSGGNDGALDVAVDGDGAILVTGESDKDYCTIKYAANGTELWREFYDSGGRDQACGVASGLGGNTVVVTGWRYDGTNYSYYTIKYNPDGSELWGKVYSCPGPEDGNGNGDGNDDGNGGSDENGDGNQGGGGSLSTPAIAGITIGAVAVFGLIGYIITRTVKKRI